VARFPHQQAARVQQQLDAQGILEKSNAVRGFGRLAAAAPRWEMLSWLGVGVVLVLACSMGRMRFPRWPLHPILFLVWNSYPAKALGFSFLVGWIIKAGVTKYGGVKTYQNLKPMMIGLIAGDILGGLIPSVIGIIYFLATGEPPRSFQVMPG